MPLKRFMIVPLPTYHSRSSDPRRMRAVYGNSSVKWTLWFTRVGLQIQSMAAIKFWCLEAQGS